MKARFAVTFELPEGATLADAKAYVEDAVSSMKGCYHPPGSDPGNPEDIGNPMFALDERTVRVTRIRDQSR